MLFNSDCLAPFLPRLREAGRCYVAYSGGLDSRVLLHSLIQLLGAEQLTAVHINHQMSANAASWQRHCQQQCADLNVEFITETISVEKSGQGLEQAARQARYAIFETLLSEGDLLLLAHHADDQVETVLYRLLRGAGPKGLAGMPITRPLGKGMLLRPLLSFPRAELEQYATQQQLSWVEDETNQMLDFDRNFLRHKVVPVLAGRWSDYGARIGHSAALCAEADSMIGEMAATDLARLDERRERIGWSIDLEAMATLPRPRKASLLRHWIASHQLPVPGHKLIETILGELLPARKDAEPLVRWGGAQLRRFRRRIYLLPAMAMNPEPSHAAEISWDMRQQQQLPDGSQLAGELLTGQGLRAPRDGRVSVCFRRGGERCQPSGRSGSNSLKKLFQEYSLEPWLRQRVPLIYMDDQLAAVGDLWVCEDFAAAEGEQGVAIRWLFPGNFH